MANPSPCGACGQVPDAEFLVTYRPGGEWFGLPPSVPLCANCLVAVADQVRQVIATATVETIETEPEGPGVLEQVEGDEGIPPVAAAPERPRRGKSRKAEDNGQAVPEETPAADVNE